MKSQVNSLITHLQRVLTTDPGMGIIRHANAGYDEAVETKERWSPVCMNIKHVVKSILLALLAITLVACDPGTVTQEVSPTAAVAPTIAPVITPSPLALLTPTAEAKATPTSPGMAVAPEWVRDAVIYQVFVRNFTSEGTLAAAGERLADLQELGVNLIYLMPIHPIGEVNRKGTLGSPYSVRDFMAIDPALGTESDLKAFVERAHALKMRVIMDLVANHTSWDNVLTVQHPDWYKRDAKGSFVPPNPDWSDVIQLDHANPGLLQYMTDMTTHYVRAVGIDGFRCDYSVGVPVPFWLALRDALKKVNPEVFLLSENDDQVLTAAFDATYDQKTYREMVSAYLQHKPQLLLDEPLSDRSKYGDKRLRARFLENHDHERVAHTFRGSPEGLRVLSTYLLTTDGIPFIENGQEVGITRTMTLFEMDKIEWSAGNPAMRELFKQGLATRNANPALRHGDIADVQSSEASVLAFVRRSPEQQVLVLISFAEERKHVSLGGEIEKRVGKELSSGEEVNLANGVDVDAWSWRIIELK
ncbi:MAG TPA: alpha-amylase family glycosyl hydrolase [Chloroflexia bacterium]|nr:alpha-amylase family glycosyl hydrolase [Chloroflexia bacterium]